MQTASLILVVALITTGCASSEYLPDNGPTIRLSATVQDERVHVAEKTCLVWSQDDLIDSMSIVQATENGENYSLIQTISDDSELRIRQYVAKLADTNSDVASLEIKYYLKDAGTRPDPVTRYRDGSKFVQSLNIGHPSALESPTILIADSIELGRWYRIDTKLNVLDQRGFFQSNPYSTDDCLYQTIFVRLGKLGFFDIRSTNRFYIGRDPH